VADPSETTRASRAATTEEAGELLGAVRALSAQVGGLQAELQAMRAERGPLPHTGADVPGWDVEAPARRDGSVWMRSIPSPSARRPSVPRLVPEIAFLVAVACLAAVARLDTAVVIVVMAGAWALVALAEWAADRAVRLRNSAAFGRYTGPDGKRTWLAPPAPETELDRFEDEEGEAAPAKLPPASSG
jgi:hypothetical protein